VARDSEVQRLKTQIRGLEEEVKRLQSQPRTALEFAAASRKKIEAGIKAAEDGDTIRRRRRNQLRKDK
jgi:cell division protein FtsB